MLWVSRPLALVFSTSASLRDDHHGEFAVLRERGGDAAQQEVGQGPEPAGADDEQVSGGVGGDVEQRRRGITVHNRDAAGEATLFQSRTPLLHELTPCVEVHMRLDVRRVDDRARPSRVRHHQLGVDLRREFGSERQGMVRFR